MSSRTNKGGARPGAGRKPSGRAPYQVRLRPELVRAIDATRDGSRSEAIERAIELWLNKKE